MMNTLVDKYLQAIASKFSHQDTSEYGYRKELEVLLEGIFHSRNLVRIAHDPKAEKGNKPDFIVIKNDVPILYLEAKAIGESLDKIEKSHQMARYYGYTNLILTDHLEFRFYRHGIRYEEPIKIAECNVKERILNLLPDNFEHLVKTLKDFPQSEKEPIKSGLHLAKIMGGKAQRIRDNVKQFMSVKSDKDQELIKIYNTIKTQLVHDLTEESFADMYAQTLVYGLFAARFYDETPKNFTRQEARDLLPKTNPLLRHFFDHIVGPDFDKRLEYIVNELCDVFSYADVGKLLEDYYNNGTHTKSGKGRDPVIHFYEDFLQEYDPVLRKKMGAYYTPLPVVNFIVRSVDYLLKKEFKLHGGLADTTKTESGVHKVQVLDPAVGTGTFISAVIGEIYKSFSKQGQKGRWPAYVHNDLLPRIHGFELMMAPYTIAHLKVAMKFKEEGFKYFNRRLGIYLTNSLEEPTAQQNMLSGLGFAESIAEESKEAAKIKNETPIMVVIGNPPYSVSSQNKGEWIQNLTKVYKEGLNERNIQPLSDDYIKFIRFAEQLIEKNGSGIVAMITNNSFLDGIIHRQMRKHLLETFDKIYILNLHGSSKKKETAPDGSIDENVFDIQQGVGILLFIRKKVVKEGPDIVHFSEVYGLREKKFEFLNRNTIKSILWRTLKAVDPYSFFVEKNFNNKERNTKTFKINEIYPVGTSGVKTHNDATLVNFLPFEMHNQPYLYRPFDKRWIDYDLKKVVRHRFNVMKHIIRNDNLVLVTKRGQDFDSAPALLSNTLVDIRVYSCPGVQGTDYAFPLYLYSENGSKTPNLNREIVDKINLSLSFSKGAGVEPEEVFDYIYAVLHSPRYREKYKEFLKIDFPRVPYPKDKKTFRKLVKFGTELRLLHLMESPKLEKFITTFPNAGSDTVVKVEYKDGKVYINSEQFFGKVPEVAWNFYIGGYQPAQKWLKDRKGRTLSNEDLEHYQKIIVALVETDKIMKEIDKVVKF